MYVERLEGEAPDETCKRCIAEYLKDTNRGTFDYSACNHCVLTQIIHQEDSSVWNGHCRFLR